MSRRRDRYSPDHPSTLVKVKKEPEIKKEKYWDRNDVDRRPRRDNDFVIKSERRSRSPSRGYRSRRSPSPCYKRSDRYRISPSEKRGRRSPSGERYRRSDERYRRSPVEEKYRPPSSDYNSRRQSRGASAIKTEPGASSFKKVKAIEIKSFLYSWCGMRKMKPIYDVEAHGEQPDTYFSCQLKIMPCSAIPFVSEETALSKKDAQSKAAWKMADYMIKNKLVVEQELPPRPDSLNKPLTIEDLGLGQNKVIKSTEESAEEIHRYGGWIPQNSRQRLNQFCQREHTNCNYEYFNSGEEHARSFICKIDLEVYSVQKEFHSTQRGSSKKQATALAAMQMVRILYKAGMIEYFGEDVVSCEDRMYHWNNPSCNPPTIDCTKEDVKPELLLPADLPTNKRKINDETEEIISKKKKVEILTKDEKNSVKIANGYIRKKYGKLQPTPIEEDSIKTVEFRLKTALKQANEELKKDEATKLMGFKFVGTYGSGWLTKGEHEIEVCLITAALPKLTLYEAITNVLKSNFEKLSPVFTCNPSQACIQITFNKDEAKDENGMQNRLQIKVSIHITSKEVEKVDDDNTEADDKLPLKEMKYAMMLFKRRKYIEKKKWNLIDNFEKIFYVIKDIAKRTSRFRLFENEWMLGIVLSQILQSINVPLATGLKMVFKKISEGLLLDSRVGEELRKDLFDTEDGKGIEDPLEKGTDLLQVLTSNQRRDITDAAKENFDLLLSQPWHVLGMEEDEVKVAMKK